MSEQDLSDEGIRKTIVDAKILGVSTYQAALNNMDAQATTLGKRLGEAIKGARLWTPEEILKEAIELRECRAAFVDYLMRHDCVW